MLKDVNPKQRIRGICKWSLPFLILFVLGGFGFFSDVSATHTGSASNDADSVQLVQMVTPTPESVLTEVPEQVIKEGKPVGILIGAIGIMLIIFISTLPSLLRKDVQNHLNENH